MEEITLEKCNLCGKDLDFWDKNSGLTINNIIGYGSIYDCNQIRVKLCCDCTDKHITYLVDHCKISPLTEYEI